MIWINSFPFGIIHTTFYHQPPTTTPFLISAQPLHPLNHHKPSQNPHKTLTHFYFCHFTPPNHNTLIHIPIHHQHIHPKTIPFRVYPDSSQISIHPHPSTFHTPAHTHTSNNKFPFPHTFSFPIPYPQNPFPQPSSTPWSTSHIS